MDPEAPAPSRTCPIHGIVIGPQGECVICRRAESDDESDPSGARGAITALVLLALTIAGIMVYRGTVGSTRPRIEALAVAPPPLEPTATPDLDVARERAREAEVRREAAEQKVAVESAMKRVPIRVYTTRKCPLCRAAREFLAEKGYKPTEIDVEESPEALAALRALNPEGSVPTLVVGEEVIVGFGPTVVMSAIYRAARDNKR
jgi:glutaredoxin 3